MSKTDVTRRGMLKTGAIAGAGVALPTIFTASSASAYTNEPTGSSVTLGFNVPQTGPYADEGADELRAYQLAVEHLNGEGDGGMMNTFSSKALKGNGILGKKVEYVTGDTQTKSDAARASAKSMIEKDGAVMITGGSSSGVAIAVQSLCQEAFLEFVYRKLRRGHVDPGLICFEITETVAITNYSVVTRFIERVHELGGQFALDDFGTGMSSFGYLQELPVDFVKIDGLFVHDMDTNPVHEAMVRSINDISHVLGKRTIAEFVERESVQDKLRDLGVDFSQGYLHGRPAPLLDGRAQANS